MPEHIDYNRGVYKQIDASTGVEVYMYADDPGVFLNAYGKELPEKIAVAAGFDVETLKKHRIRKARMAEAAALIDADLNAPIAGAKREVVSEKDGFKVMDIGLGRFHVDDPDGNQLTTAPLSREIADRLMEQLVPDSAEEEEEVEDKSEDEDKEPKKAPDFKRDPAEKKDKAKAVEQKGAV